MAQAPAAPWSRWDAPGFQFISSNTAPPAIQYDTGVGLPPSDSFIGEGGTFIGSNQLALVGQRVNADNPEFLDCIYGAPNTAAQYVELCLRDNGCCQMGCCENVSWQEKYRWALALIIIFCIFVVIVVVVSIFCWLFNRAKDKRQKKMLLGSTQGLSPAASQASIAGLPAGQNAAGYYPYVGGPKQPY
uniref:CX domain-containing protein n=2 Tax=Ascaris TaxID=6251 RepID=A0A0M3HYQ8_ASCLU